MADDGVQLTFDDYRKKHGRGGPREGAGRPRKVKDQLQHVRRAKVPKHGVAHVTVKVRKDVPKLRDRRFLQAFRKTLAKGCERGDFRVVHYSIQANHVHLLVEASGNGALGRGMNSVGVRFARAVNRVFGRKGPVLLERFHARVCRTPTEVRRALAYVLLNVRKHWKQRKGVAPPVRLDEASSGHWFDGWEHPPPVTHPPGLRDVAPARFYLTRVLWREQGLIDPVEVPGL